MEISRPLEPNPHPGRRLTEKFFNDLFAYQEWVSSLGRGYGLLSASPKATPYRAFLSAPDAVSIVAIEALGERGLPIISGGSSSEEPIRPLDVGDLGIGRHRIYACRSHERRACGELFEDPGVGDQAPSRLRRFRTAPVVLEPAPRHLNHADWLPVAEIERVKEGGSVRTILDESFHPPIVDMRSWSRPNPLARFAAKAQAEIDPLTHDFATDLLRHELRILEKMASSASTDTVFLQAQRCLGMVRAIPGMPCVIDGRLETYLYSPDTFCRFLTELERSLDKGIGPTFPDVLEIDGTRFLKIDGQMVLEKEGSLWHWNPPRDPFVAGGLAIFLPRASSGELPQLHYSQQRKDPGSFRVARFGKELSAAGAAAVLSEPHNPIKQLLVTVAVIDMHHRLRQHLENGHALYYC